MRAAAARSRLALLALAAGGFGIGLTEFVILGLLPEVAGDFDVSEAVAGYLISGYALSVAAGAVGLTLALRRIRPKRALLMLLLLFIAGNLLCAVAPSYPVMLAGRVLAALCHGAFFGIGAAVAAATVPPERSARAIATMFAGLTTANLLGVPLGTFLGQSFGWRSTFWAITLVGIAALASIAALVPAVPSTPHKDSTTGNLAAIRRPPMMASLLTTLLAFGGMFGGLTYIAYTLTEVSGFQPGAIPYLLLITGLGVFIGNILGGRLADAYGARALIIGTTALAVVLAAFAVLAWNPIVAVVALFLVGLLGFGIAPGLQLRTMALAPDAPAVASGANIAAFNLGNALGAWLGGLALSAGLGFQSPLAVGAVTSAAGVLLLLRVPGHRADPTGAGARRFQRSRSN